MQDLARSDLNRELSDFCSSQFHEVIMVFNMPVKHKYWQYDLPLHLNASMPPVLLIFAVVDLESNSKRQDCCIFQLPHPAELIRLLIHFPLHL